MKKFIAFIVVFFVLLALTGTFVGGVVVGHVLSNKQSATAVPPNSNNPSDLGPINEIMTEISHGYVDKIGRQKLVDGAVNGMIKTLGDPYTRRLKQSAYSDFETQTSGRFGGVGMELGMKDNKITVVAPIKGTPADRAGAQTGDRIVKIDSKETTGMALEQAVKLIRGDIGTKVTLTFVRNGGKPFTKALTREQIKMPNVSSKVLNNDIGYIQMLAFNSDTGRDVSQEMNALKTKKVKGMIVDLRNNPGGLLTEAISLSSLFIKSGPIVKVKSRTGKIETFTANNGADDKIPLVVLVNRGSASASEIFAGAIQDTGRGVIVGEKSFGKGSVQTVIPLNDGSALIMTTAKYLTPKNRLLSKVGVMPDVVIKLPMKDFHKVGTASDVQLNKAKEVLRGLID
ncbi:MAG: S41 family peptidase [Actinomycetota bacterium]|nr:S41 family peptidase [Actinomycetota bacterium]